MSENKRTNDSAARGERRLSRRQVLKMGGLGAVGIGAITALSSCGSDSNSTNSGDEGSSGGGYSKDDVYVLVALLSADPFWADIKKGAQDAADQLGVTFEFTGPQQYDTEAQVSTAQQKIGTNPKGMILPAFSAEAMPNVINQAVEANIPVVTIDSDAPNSKRAAYVGTDHYELGRIMGQKLVEYTGGEAKVGVATAPGQTNLERRIDGIKDVFASNRGMRIVQTVDNKGDVSVCARVVTQMLQANPDINAVACVNAASAGVATALRETNRVGEVTAVTSDINKPIADAVRNGAIRSTMVQRTYMEGYYGIQMLALLSHPTSFMQNQLQAGISPVPEEFDTGVIVVDKSNVGAFS